jgi:phage-related protein
MLDLGTLRLGIKVDSDSAKSELNKVGGEVEGTGSKVAGLAEKAKMMIKAFVAAYAVKELAKLGKAALDAFAQFEQLEGGVQKIFGDEASKQVMKNAERAYKTAGMSANEYMEQVTSFSASLIQSLDGDTVKAAKVADMAIQDMSDNANVFGSDMTSIQNAYQGFAKQNYTMLDNLKLGYGGTKEEMQRLLADAEKLSGQKYDISNLNDVYEAIHVVQEEMHITGTTSKEASTTIEGSTRQMKSSWENMLTAMGRGEGVERAMNQFLESLGTVAKNVGPVAVRIVVSLAKALVTGIPAAMGMLGDFMSKLADSLSADSGGKMGTAAGKLVVKLINGLVENAPKLAEGALKLTAALVEALISAAVSFTKAGFEAMRQFVSGFLDAHPNIAKAVETIGKVFEIALKPAKVVIDAVTAAWKKLTGQKGSKKFSVSTPFSGAIQSIKDTYNKWKDVLGQKASKTFSIVKEGFSSALESMKSIYNKWKDILAQKAKKIFTVENRKSGDASGHRIGLREVPYDGYAATLHKGETVLTAAETNQYKKYLNGLESAASGIVNGINASNMMMSSGSTEARIVINLGGTKIAEQIFRLNKQGKLAFEG